MYDRRGIVATLRTALVAFVDVLSSKLAKPLYIKLFGDEIETSLIALSESERVALDDAIIDISRNSPKSIFSTSSYLKSSANIAPAKGFLFLPFYNPIDIVKDISAPILFVSASRDESLFPASTIRKAFNEAFRGRSMELNATHYELYSGRLFNYTSKTILDYIKEHFK